jgi:hypothetical protein
LWLLFCDRSRVIVLTIRLQPHLAQAAGAANSLNFGAGSTRAGIRVSWLRITGDKQRLTHNTALARSIKHRFPYIDPLHHLQVELVRRWRAGQGDERVQTGIHISINGIAAGLRNTG